MDYVIWIYARLHNSKANLISKKTFGLCNPKVNHESTKRFLDYIIQKLWKKTFRLCNLNINYILTFLHRNIFEIKKFMGVKEQWREV